MTRKNIIIAVAVLALLLGFKALFPETSGRIVSKAKSFFAADINYRQVLSDIGERISVFRETEGENAAVSAELTASQPETLGFQREQLGTGVGEFGFEEGRNAGEEAGHEEELPLPKAVSAFLESQKDFADLSLPENVSYDYREFPGEKAVPVEGMNSSGFGYRVHPIHGDVRFHYGTDFAAWSGEDVLAFADGEVSFAGYCDSYGNYIIIDHGDDWQSLYAHCSTLYVEEGDAVKAGDKIALVGSTGLVTGPHLHFELTQEGVYVNPEYYVN